MTLDERIEFLVQSTESLHATVMEMSSQIAAHGKQLEEHTKQLQLDAENIRALVRIAEAHEQRLTDLEEPPPQGSGQRGTI
jgi:uncharacterized protein YaaN involved in tellurite resistance